MPEQRFEDCPLRARKRARTRVALVGALIERLAERPLEQIQVRELAEAAGISQATFFNYFPTKDHLLAHYIQLWSLKMGLLARALRQNDGSPLSAIETILVTTAQMNAPHPRVMAEIIAAQARTEGFEAEPIELAERLLYLDDAAAVMDLPDRGLGDILPALIREAVATDELPACTDVDTLTLSVAAIFFGIPTLLGCRQAPVADLYRAQLQLIWAGARNS